MQATWVEDQQRGLLYSAEVFRVLLNAFARPGTLGVLPQPDIVLGLPVLPDLPFPPNRFALGALATLLDREVTFCLGVPPTYGPEDEAALAQRISLATGALLAEPARAAFALCLDGTSSTVLTALHQGTLAEPEAGATVFLAVEALSEQARPGALALELHGPGIREMHMMCVTGLASTTLDAICATRRDYPLGVDVYLVDAAGRCVGLPRTTRITVVVAQAGQEG